MKVVTGKIVRKYMDRGLQPLNGEMMMFDFPFSRPLQYWVVLDDGSEGQVAQDEYEQHAIGDVITIECFEVSDLAILVPFLVIICLAVAATLYLLAFSGG